MRKYRIPFNKPAMVGDELTYMAEAVAIGRISADGLFSQKCQTYLEQYFGVDRALLTTSCTGALEAAAILSGVEAGDEVIMPAFTFVSTANAFVLRDAKPVFVDIRADTMNIDERLVADAVTSQTRAVVPVHYAGIACEMDTLMAIAEMHGLMVIEDAAHAVAGSYRGRPLGTIGDIGTFSFHETKDVICGEGGALLINRPDLVERAEIIRDKGTNRRKFLRGQTDKYSWVDIGSSYGLADILAAYLFAQLEKIDKIKTLRSAVYDRYITLLSPLARHGDIGLPHIPDYCTPSCHMLYMTVFDEDVRRRLIAYLSDHGIQAVFHYVPLHTSPYGERMGYRSGMLPVTEEYASRLLRLPFFTDMKSQEVDDVVEQIYAFFGAQIPSTG